MFEKIIIKEINGENKFLTIDTIQELLKINNGNLALVFENGKTEDNYRKLLQQELPKYHVFNVRWLPEIWIKPSIETSKILALKEDIHNATISFREDGIRLMKILGVTHQINPFKSTELFGLKRKSRENKQRGKVNEDWNYYFHGAECQFNNHKTGQVVELVITNGSEFGALDSYFFLQYLKSTVEFKKLADFFSDDTTAVTKAFNILEDLGCLQRINEDSQRGIIAK